MKLAFYAPLWGSNEMPFEAFLDKVCEMGFQGIEAPFEREHVSEQEKQRRLDLMSARGLEFIAQHYETVTTDFEQYKVEFKSRLTELAALRPIFINSQTGRDFFSFEQSLELIDLAKDVATQANLPIYHETHRGRFNFASHITSNFVKARPDILQTADFSHFCCVAGTLLQDQQSNIQSIIPTIRHIHARVGYTEGPQVANPAAPEVSEALTAHMTWWQAIIDQAIARGDAKLTILTEFGPPPYMPIEPFSCKPLADQWEVNTWMKDYIKANIAM